MPILDILPVGSKSYDRPSKITPIYLVLAENPKFKNRPQKFIAIKLDDSQQVVVKIVAIEISEDINVSCENYQEILNSTDKALYKEIMIPWYRVIQIQNLIYKQK